MVASQSLEELINKHNKSSHPAKILVYDSFIPWAQKLAERLGLDGAASSTQSCAVSAIYYLVNQGALNVPLEGEVASMPWMPVLCVNDLPSIINGKSSDPAALSFLLNQISNFQKVKWILFNTFDKLEDEQNVDSCITWLDTKGSGSVVYDFMYRLEVWHHWALGKEQMEELAWGLKKSNTHFMWGVRESEEKKIPSNFLEDTSEMGLVVSWCPQLEVPAHKAVGCFLTHCGWNSTVEALSLGVPMIAMPQFLDQTTNAKFVEDHWRVGVRVKADEKGVVKKEEMEMRIREMMEGERGNEMKRNAETWKELAKEAVNEGGISHKNIEEFVTEILCS